MALIKIYAEPKHHEEVRAHVGRTVKLIGAAALNVPDFETTPGRVETVLVEGLDLVGIDYILEIVGVERPDEQQIADNFIAGLNTVYPETLFSVYFSHINEVGMSNTPRPAANDEPIDMKRAIELASSQNG